MELHPVKRVKKHPLNLDNHPVLGIASPVYDFNFSRVMRNWMKTIPRASESKRVFFVDTAAGLPADSIRVARTIMQGRNYTLIGALLIAKVVDFYFMKMKKRKVIPAYGRQLKVESDLSSKMSLN